VSKQQREVVADWLIVIGAVVLFVSLFLTWSHQFSRPFLAVFGASAALAGVPRDPTAWQVYSTADVLLALLALALVLVALFGSRGARLAALAAVAVALAFTVHALNVPPTNGADIFDPSLSVPNLYPNSPSAGPGEAVALIGLGAAVAGLLVSFTAD
jgi:hypothetical protein